MTVEAKVILDSVSPEGIRLTTLQIRNPRLIHSEFMTHRAFSRNASSSRAIPISRSIEDILTDPAEPEEWGSNAPGMQSHTPLTPLRAFITRRAWHGAKRAAILAARVSQWAGAHKQISNRMLEPWSHISLVVSATNWANYMALRNHEDADPTIRAQAQAIYLAMAESKPMALQPGEWHLPYVTDFSLPLETLKKQSAARIARVSYLTHEGRPPSLQADLDLYDRLAGSFPIHASPLEHVATPAGRGELVQGNFHGWIQHRSEVEGATVYDR